MELQAWSIPVVQSFFDQNESDFYRLIVHDPSADPIGTVLGYDANL